MSKCKAWACCFELLTVVLASFSFNSISIAFIGGGSFGIRSVWFVYALTEHFGQFFCFFHTSECLRHIGLELFLHKPPVIVLHCQLFALVAILLAGHFFIARFVCLEHCQRRMENEVHILRMSPRCCRLTLEQ